MAIAYFVMLHNKPYQFEWLLEAIYSPDDLFLVHLDAKSLLGLKADRRGTLAGVRHLIAGRKNIRLMRPRFTNWGGWSLSRTLLDAIATLLASDTRWSRFVNLSGQCYPIKPMAQVREQLLLDDGRQYVELRHFSTLPQDDWHLRWIPMWETPLKAFQGRGAKPPPVGFDIDHKGSQWCMLSRDFCEWMLASELLPRVRRYLRTLLLSDELIVQTMLCNGPYRDRVAPHYGRAIEWPGPKLLRAADFDWLRDSPALFARKFDAAIDDEVLKKLAAMNGTRMPAHAAQR